MIGLDTKRTLDVEIAIGEEKVRARALRLIEGVSDPGGAWAEIPAGEDVDPDSFLDRDASIVATWADETVRTWTMRVARVSFLGEVDGALRYELELRPVFWFCRFTRNIRKFRDQTTEAIVSAVLAECGVRHQWRTTRACASRPYCVQYRESTFDFVSRLLEFEGIHYFFEPDGSMVIADRSPAAAPVDGQSTFTLTDTEGALGHGDFAVTDFERGSRIGSGKATVNDHDWKKPKLSLLSSATGARDQVREIYDYPTGYRDPSAGQLLAQLRLEALECEKRFGRGTSTVPAFAAGLCFDLVHEELVSFSDTWFLVHVEHDYRAEGAAGDGKVRDATMRPLADGPRYVNTFRCIPGAVPYRPASSTPTPVVQGNHTAMVRGPVGEEIHTDVYGRAKVQFHWDREAKGTDEDSRWIRTCQEISTSIALSRVGWEISVGYIAGDPERPVGLARHINGQMIPTYGQPSSKRMMTIKSETYPGKAGYNELRMDDSGGAMAMDWHAQKDLRNAVENNRTEAVANNSKSLVKTGVDRQVVKNQSVTIGSNEKRNVGGSTNIMIGQNRTHAVGGSETISVKKDYSVTVQGNDTETVGGVRRTIAGGISVAAVSPQALLQSLVPKPADLVGQVAGAALGDRLGGIATAALTGGNVGQAATSALGGAAGSLGGPALGAAASGYQSGGVGGAIQGAGRSLLGGGSGGGASTPGASAGVVGAFQRGLGIPSAQQAQQQLQQMFSPEALQGRLMQAISPAALLDKLFHGTIDRTVQKRFVRTVGGAQIEIAGGSISHDAGKLLVEAVGGIKLTVAAKEDIAQTVNGPLLTTVGGVVIKKAKGDLSYSAKVTSVRVGINASFEGGERIEIRGKTIEMKSTQKLELKAGDLKIELTPAKATLAGSMKLDAETKLKVRGNPDKLTA